MNAKAVAALGTWSPDRRLENRAALESTRTQLLDEGVTGIPAVAVSRRVAVLGLGGIGGSGKVAADTARGLTEAGHDVVYVSGPRPAFADQAPANTVSAPVPSRPSKIAGSTSFDRLSQRLVELFDSQRTQVIFVHYCAGLLESCLAARERATHKPAVVAVLHGTDVSANGRSGSQVRALRQALAEADDIVAVSNWLAREAKVRGLVADHRPIRVIHNSVDIERFRPGRYAAHIRSEFASENQLLLVHVSNMRRVKRAPDCVAILSALVDRGIDARLLALGDGPDAPEMNRRVEAFGLGSAVRRIQSPSSEILPALMAAGDLTLVPSSSESFSLAAMESMACGVPVICGECGGLPEILSGMPSAPIPPKVGDIEGLAAMCLETLEDTVYGRRQTDGLRLAVRDFPRHRQISQYAAVVEALTP